MKFFIKDFFIFCVVLDNRSASFPKQNLQQQLFRGSFLKFSKELYFFEEKKTTASTVVIDYTSLLQMQNKIKYPNFLFLPKSASSGKYSKTEEGPKLRKVSK